MEAHCGQVLRIHTIPIIRPLLLDLTRKKSTEPVLPNLAYYQFCPSSVK